MGSTRKHSAILVPELLALFLKKWWKRWKTARTSLGRCNSRKGSGVRSLQLAKYIAQLQLKNIIYSDWRQRKAIPSLKIKY